MKRLTRWGLFLPVLLACLLTVGCGTDAPVATTSAPPAPVRTLSATPAAQTAQKPDDKPKPPTYTAPYPKRENLFTPPQRNQRVARRTFGDQDEAVSLIGFISVDEPKAVLSIDGVVTSLAAGGQKYGIQVITIQPPEVTLQRGRNRWTAALE